MLEAGSKASLRRRQACKGCVGGQGRIGTGARCKCDSATPTPLHLCLARVARRLLMSSRRHTCARQVKINRRRRHHHHLYHHQRLLGRRVRRLLTIAHKRQRQLWESSEREGKGEDAEKGNNVTGVVTLGIRPAGRVDIGWY